MARGRPTSEDLRKLIIKKYQNEKSYGEIAIELDISNSSVQYIIKKFNDTGSTASAVQNRGRKTKITDRDHRALSSIVRQKRQSTIRGYSAQWAEAIGRQVGRECIRQHLHHLSYKSYKAKKKPFLTASQLAKRLQWAKARRNWVTRQWETIIFSDESKFEVCIGDNGVNVTRKRDEAFHRDCLRRTVKFPDSCMVWGCIS